METQNNFPVEPVTGPCWSCGAVISRGDNYCKKCGKGQGTYVPWQYKHRGVIILTLFGLGPFSLFFVWRSPVLSRNAKLAYTGFILLFTWYAVNSFYKAWTVFQSVLGGTQVY